jgi:uncharacterized protein YtpQ (UPF0354 family)
MFGRKAPLQAYAYLRPVVRDEGAAPGIQLSRDDSPVLRDYSSDFVIAYLLDKGREYTYVQNRDLARHKISADELHTAGMSNLARLAADRLEIHTYGSIYAVMLGGTFEASLILVDDLWTVEFRRFVSDAYVAVVPARDILAFGSDSKPEAIPELMAVVDRVWNGGDHLLTRSVLRRAGDTWTARPAA